MIPDKGRGRPAPTETASRVDSHTDVAIVASRRHDCAGCGVLGLADLKRCAQLGIRCSLSRCGRDQLMRAA